MTNHILIVTGEVDGDGCDEREYEAECPGLTDWCESWVTCHHPLTDDELDTLDSDGEMDIHGVEHRNIGGDVGIAVRSGQCFVSCNDYLGDAAAELDLKAGRYEVDWDTAEPDELLLFVVKEAL